MSNAILILSTCPSAISGHSYIGNNIKIRRSGKEVDILINMLSFISRIAYDVNVKKSLKDTELSSTI